MAIVAADVAEAALHATVDELTRLDVEAIGVVTDVTDPAAVGALGESAIERFGGYDIVCNNAGVGPPGGLLESDLGEFRWIVDVNLYGVVNGVKALVPHLVAKGGGHVVNTASVAGLLTQPGLAAYNVSKHGVVALSESLYYELAMMNVAVGVSVLCPAWTPTRISESGRLRPHGVAPPAGPITARVRTATERLMAKARRSADEVAAAVVEAVRENRFYVITHAGILPLVRRRHEDIELGRNPSIDHGW
jgi:NAD(P)-dependent dehydrogenase (short-subunit alcohol dehydrogenase family)